jgi:hypothetical protein
MIAILMPARLSPHGSSGKVAARNLFPSGSLSLRLDRNGRAQQVESETSREQASRW